MFGKRMALAMLVALAVGSIPTGQAQDVNLPSSIKHLPRVVQTIPANLNRSVEPDVTEIVVVFDKPMDPSTYSFKPDPLKPIHFPLIQGRPVVSEDKKTWRFPVRLEPGRHYSLWLNSSFSQGFVSQEGDNAEEYQLIFMTASR